MVRTGISHLAMAVASVCMGVGVSLAAQEQVVASAGTGGDPLAVLDGMVGRNFTFCMLKKDECLDFNALAAAIRQEPDGTILIDFSDTYSTLYLQMQGGALLGGYTRGSLKPVEATANSIRIKGPFGGGYELVRDGDRFEMIEHTVMGNSEFRFTEPEYSTPRIAKRLAKLDAKLGPPTGGGSVTRGLARADAGASLASEQGSGRSAGPIPVAGQRFGVWQQMSGGTWEFAHDDNGVTLRCFIPVLIGDDATAPAIPVACDSGERNTWKVAPEGANFSVGSVVYTLLPDGSAVSNLKVEGKTQTRSVMRMVAPDRVDIFHEQAKANSRKPKWIRTSAGLQAYTRVDPETVRAALAAGPKRIAAAREALIPQQWGFLADLPGKVEIGATSNAGQRGTLALDVRREAATVLLRNAQWVERGKVMRINYTAGTGANWSDTFTRTGKGTFAVVHSGPGGTRNYTANLVKDEYVPIPQLVMSLGSMSCGPAKFVMTRSDYNGTPSYSDSFTAMCRGGEYGGFSTSSPTSDSGASTTFFAYSPENLKSLRTQLAGLDRMYDQSDRDYIAGEKRDAIEKRQQARIEAENKARMRSVIMNGIAGIASAAVQGYQQGQQQRYETERNVAAYTAIGLAKRAETTGQPMDARAFNQALESALKGTVRQSVIDEMRVGTGYSSRSGAGSSGYSGSRSGSAPGGGNHAAGERGGAASRSVADGGSVSETGDPSGFDEALARVAAAGSDPGTSSPSGSGSTTSSGSSGDPVSSGGMTLVVDTGEKERARQAKLDAEAAQRKADYDARVAAEEARYAAQRAEEQRKAEAAKPKVDCNGNPIGATPPPPQYDSKGNRIAGVCRM